MNYDNNNTFVEDISKLGRSFQQFISINNSQDFQSSILDVLSVLDSKTNIKLPKEDPTEYLFSDALFKNHQSQPVIDTQFSINDSVQSAPVSELSNNTKHELKKDDGLKFN